MDYNNHYIRTDTNNNITQGFSDAFEQPQDSDILINEQGGRHFELFEKINPPLRTENGIPLYKWVDTEVQRITDAKANVEQQLENTTN